MKTLRTLLFRRWLVTLIGCLLLALVVFFLGPVVAIAGTVPLESLTARLIVIALILAVWAGATAFAAWRGRRNDRAMVDGLTAGPGGGAAAEIALLRERLEATLRHLKKAPGADGSRHLYDLPWYILIGPPGSGKTTVLTKSGVNFVGADGRGAETVRGIGGTRNCDWWFGEQAILIDTAGRYTTQDSDQDADRTAWLGFVDLLKTYRPRQPINGALVMMSLVDLAAMSETDRRGHGRAVRERLTELRERLGVDFPVYVVFTKLDKAAGFVEFFDDLSREERRQVWGATLPIVADRSAPQLSSVTSEQLEQLMARLSDRMFQRLQEEADPRRRILIHSFPAQLASLRLIAEEFLDIIFTPSRYERTALLRGVYLSSGVQEGTPVDRIMGMLARSFGLPAVRAAALAGGGRSYFLGDLLEKVIFAEARLVGSDPKVERRMMWLRRGVYAASAAAVVLAIAAWSIGTVDNLALIRQDEQQLQPYREAVAPFADRQVQDVDFRAIVPALDKLRDLAGIDRPSAPILAHLGLYQGAKLDAAGQQKYRRALNSWLLPRLMLRLAELLNVNGDQPDIQYQLLKAYLTLGGEAAHFDRAFVTQLFAANWAASYPLPQDEPLRQALGHHLDALLAAPLVDAAIDRPLVDRVRRNLSQMPLAKRAYVAISESNESRALPQWRLIDHTGPAADRVLTRRSGKPLTDGVPGIFTHDGFYHVFLPKFADVAHSIADEHWVLGGNAPSEAEVKSIDQSVLQLYEQDFINHWDQMLGDLTIVPFKNNAEAAEIVGVLSGPTSPFKTLFSAVVAETQLTRPPEEAAVGAMVAPGKAAAAQNSLAGAERFAKAAGFVPAGQAVPGAAVEAHFKPLAAFVGTGGPAPIDDLVRTLNDTYLQLNRMAAPGQDLIHGGASADSGAALRTLKADAAHLPAPLSGMVASIGQGTQSLTTAGVRDQIRADWNSAIASFCQQALEGRYPIKRGADIDVTLDDFVRLFAPGGQLDSFFNNSLKPFVDVSHGTWHWQSGDGGPVGLSDDVLVQFQHAARIRESFFGAGGAQPALHYRITPVTLDAGTSQAVLEINGQSITYAHGPLQSSQVVWPAPNGADQARLALLPVNGAPGGSVSATGPWAWFRLIEQARIEAGAARDGIRIVFRIGEHAVSYDVQAGSVLNPLTLQDLNDFRCPRI